MIRIELILKEKEKIEFKNKVATNINVELNEERIKATQEEKEACKLLKSKLNLEEEIVIDKTKNKEFEGMINLLKEILK